MPKTFGAILNKAFSISSPNVEPTPWDAISESAIERATEIVTKGSVKRAFTTKQRDEIEKAISDFDFQSAAKL